MLNLVINNEYIPLDADLHIKHKNNGRKIIDFKIDCNHHNYHLLNNETIVEYENLFYTVKLNDATTIATIECHLDLDDFKKVFFKKFSTTTLNLHDTLMKALAGTGWTVSNSFIKEIKRSIEMNNVTTIDVIDECINLFNITYEFDNLNKVIRVIDPEIILDKGFYVTSQSNLISSQMTSDTYDFCTCLKCFGKTNDETEEELTFSSINKGKDYLEDFSYSKKIIWGVFKDDRFTDAQSLLDAGKKELKRRCNPDVSYVVTFVNLSKLDNDTYYLLDFKLHDVVTYKDDLRKRDVVERIIEYDEYPSNPENDVITLSDQPLSIESLNNDVYSKVVDLQNKFDGYQGSALQKAKLEASNLINEFATKGHKYETENELYFLDTLPKEKAKFVMRQNLGGIAFSQNGWQGPYISAWTIDGRFNADFITAGILRGIKITNGNNFNVDAAGNMTARNAKFSGSIEGASTIKLGNNFNVDAAGNMTARNAKFSGSIEGASTIKLGNNFNVDAAGNMTARNAKFSGDIVGGTITGETTIKVGTNIEVGNNVILNGEEDNLKIIKFGDRGASIWFSEDTMYLSTNGGLDDSLITVYGSNSIMRSRAYMQAEEVNILSERDSNGLSNFFTANNDGCMIQAFRGLKKIDAYGNFNVFGEKNRVVETDNFGIVKLSAVESTYPIFEDVGSGHLNDKGICFVWFDAIFFETVNTDCNYCVFLNKSGRGDLYCEIKNKNYFIVKGTPGLNFDWRVSAKQRGYEIARLDKFEKSKTDDFNNDCLDKATKLLNKEQKSLQNYLFCLYDNYLKKKENVIYEI